LNQIVPKGNFKLTNGDLKAYTYKGDSGIFLLFALLFCFIENSDADSVSQGNSVDCFYCPTCTSHAYHHQHIMGDKIVIRTALLKGSEKWGKPAAEIFGTQKWDWQPQTADNIFDTTPPA
jgi:hypothetical protein